MVKYKVNRRKLIKNAALGAGALSLNPVQSIFQPHAFGQATPGAKDVVVIYYLRGGMTGSFACANSFLGSRFGGISDQNILVLQNGLAVHNSYQMLPKFALDHMATIGVNHGNSGHTGAARSNFLSGDIYSAAHILAHGMGGLGTSKLVVAGGENPTRREGIQSYRGVSDQRIFDMRDAIDVLGGGERDVYTPDRSLAAFGLEASLSQSNAPITGNANSLACLTNSYPVTVASLKRPPQPFDRNELMNAYNLRSTVVADNDVAAQLALAEVMIRQDANIILASNRGPWDNHNNPTMENPLNRMRTQVMPQIARFLTRTMGDPDNNIAPIAGFENYNVTFMIMGDFLRTAPESGHSTGGAYTIISKKIKNGTTAQVSNQGRITDINTPNTHALWTLLGEITGASQESMAEIIRQSAGGSLADKNFHRSLLRV